MERHTYVIDLIKAMREQGWLWTEEFIWHKRILILENGRIDLEYWERLLQFNKSKFT